MDDLRTLQGIGIPVISRIFITRYQKKKTLGGFNALCKNVECRMMNNEVGITMDDLRFSI